MDEKRAKMLEKLEQRKKEREIKKLGTETGQSTKKSATPGQIFEREFESDRKIVLGLLEKYEESTENSAIFAEVRSRLSKMRKFLAESASYLSAFDRKRAQNLLDELQTKAESVFKAKENSADFSQDFAFSNVKPEITGSEPEITGYKPEETGSSRDRGTDLDQSDSFADVGKQLKASNLIGQTILFGAESDQSDLILENLRDCVIKIVGGHPSTIYASNLHNCTLIAYPVSTSIFLADCQRSKFCLACQQLRIHRSHDLTIYCHVTSKAVIEQCTNVRFAPYALRLRPISDERTINRLLERAGLDLSTNNFDRVNDFDWPVKSRPSPNWSILSENEREWFEA